MLDQWLHPSLFEKKDLLKEQFNNQEPFAHLIIEPFLKEEKIKELKQALDSQNFDFHECDLYEFLKTQDFKHTTNPTIKAFRNFIFSKEFIEFISSITSQNLKLEAGTLHSLLLKNTHYLLPHDDVVEKRKIAFMLYTCESFSKNEGGSLNLFETKNKIPIKSLKSIFPQWNRFVCFSVSDKSFHSIEEVESIKERLSVSGWFY